MKKPKIDVIGEIKHSGQKFKDFMKKYDIDENKFSVIESNVSDSRYLTSQVVNGEFYILGGNKSSNYSTMLDNFEVLNLEQEGYFCF